MAVITSIRNGKWTDASTWSGGVVPTSTDEIVIANYIVTLDTDFLVYNSISVDIDGILEIESSGILRIGKSAYNAGTEGTLVFNGGGMMGDGNVYVQFGYVKTADNAPWSVVGGSLSFTYGPTNADNGKITWDVQRVLFINTGELFIANTNGGKARELTETRLRNCIFVGAPDRTMSIGCRGGVAQFFNMYVHNCDFRGFSQVNIVAASSGEAQWPFIREFKDCTFFGSDTTSLWLRCTMAGAPHGFIGCMFINATPGSGTNTPFMFTNCYVGNDLLATSAYTTGSAHVDSVFSNSISHLANRSLSNFHMMSIWNAEHSYFEGWGTGGPNVLLRPSTTTTGKVVWKNNIMAGIGQFCASTLNYATDYDIRNNTVASIGADEMQFFMQETQNMTPLSEGCVLRNNLQVCTAPAVKDNGFATTAGGITANTPIDADYNCRWNMSGEWFRGYIRNTNTGTHNVEINPQFVDPTREIEKWGQFITGNSEATYKAVWDILLRMNGFDGVHLGPVPSVGFSDLLAWLRKGFTPTNLQLQTAGEGGTFIGAIVPTSEIEEPVTPVDPDEPFVPIDIQPNPDSKLTWMYLSWSKG